MNRMKKILVRPAEVLDIVSDGLMATRAAEGKGVPVLVLDTSQRPDLDSVIAAHQGTAPGDVIFGWGRSRDESLILLRLHFRRPVEATTTILFDVATQGILVDAILSARAFYFQGGGPDTKFRDDLDAPRILIGIDPMELEADWDRIYREQLVRKLRQSGIPKKIARAQADSLIADLRQISRFRGRF